MEAFLRVLRIFLLAMQGAPARSLVQEDLIRQIAKLRVPLLSQHSRAHALLLRGHQHGRLVQWRKEQLPLTSNQRAFSNSKTQSQKIK